MKRVLLAVGMALALGATPIAAQTRVSVAVGFGVPRPYVAGVLIVGRRPVYYPRRAFYHRPPLFVARRVYVVRHRHHYRRYHFDYDRDGE